MGEQLEDAVRVAVCELDHAANYWFARSGKSVAGARFADAAGRLRAAMGDAVSERDEARAELEALRGREHWLKQGVCPECRGCGDIRPEVGCPHCDATGCTEMARAMSRLEDELEALREAAKEVVRGIYAGKDMGEHLADVCDLRALLEPGDPDAGGTK